MDKKFCIFDMDGTLVDSMGYWRMLGTDYVRAHGKQPVEGLMYKTQVMTMMEAAQLILTAFQLPGTPKQAVAEMEAIMEDHYRHDVPLKPGVLEYLNALKARGSKLCVATATAEPLAHQCFQRLEVDGLFEFIISCESIGVSKARPDIYLMAAERLGAHPEECAVFEDALYAARTAKQAGFYTVGIEDASQARDWAELSALADEIITDWTRAL